RAVNQNIVAENCLNHIQQRVVRDDLVRPVKKQMQSIEPLRRTLATAFNQLFERSAKRRNLRSREHLDRKQKPVAFIIFDLLSREPHKKLPRINTEGSRI